MVFRSRGSARSRGVLSSLLKISLSFPICSFNFGLRFSIFYHFNFALTAFSEMIVEFPVASSMIILSFSCPHSVFCIFLSMFFIFFLFSRSSSWSRVLSSMRFTLLMTPSTLVTYPLLDGPDSIVIMWGILTVASALFTTLILRSSSFSMSRVHLQGSCCSAASTSALWYLHCSQVIEKRYTFPKKAISVSDSVRVNDFSLHIGHSCPWSTSMAGWLINSFDEQLFIKLYEIIPALLGLLWKNGKFVQRQALRQRSLRQILQFRLQ